MNEMPTNKSYWKGLDKIHVVLDDVSVKNNEFKSDLLDTLASRFLEILEPFVPKRKGDYWRSIRVMNKTNNSISIGTEKKLLFTILEFTGANEHRVEAKNVLALHWVDETGEDRFAKWVIIPRMEPKPHFRPAIEQLKKEKVDIVYTVAQRHFKFASRFKNKQTYQQQSSSL